MKRLFLILLSALVLLSELCVPASAQTDSSSEVIDEALLEQLEILSDNERIAVHITAGFTITAEERSVINAQIAEEAGVDLRREIAFTKEKRPTDEEQDRLWMEEYFAWQDFRRLRYESLKALRQQKLTDFMDSLDITPDQMDDGKYHIIYLFLPEKLDLTVQQIKAAAHRENVRTITLYSPPEQKPHDPQSDINKELYEKLRTMDDDDRVWVNVRMNQLLGIIDNDWMETLILEMYGVNMTHGYPNDNPMYYQDPRSRLNKDYNEYRCLVRYDKLNLSPEDQVDPEWNYKHETFTAYLSKLKILQICRDVSIFLISETDPPVKPTEAEIIPSAVDELYSHQTVDGDIDYRLDYVYSDAYPGACHALYGDILIYNSPSYALYADGMGFAVYDTGEEKYYGLNEAWEMDYEGLHEAFYELMTEHNPDEKYGEVVVIGDMDNDKEQSVLDVTLIQRCHAQMREWDDDLYSDPAMNYSYLRYGFDILYRSDYDRNGERDITDAAMLQRRIAYLIEI